MLSNFDWWNALKSKTPEPAYEIWNSDRDGVVAAGNFNYGRHLLPSRSQNKNTVLRWAKCALSTIYHRIFLLEKFESTNNNIVYSQSTNSSFPCTSYGASCRSIQKRISQWIFVIEQFLPISSLTFGTSNGIDHKNNARIFWLPASKQNSYKPNAQNAGRS